MRRKSLTHESLNPAISGEADKNQNLQLSLFIPLLNEIINNTGKLIIVSEQKDTYCKKYMENSTVSSFMSLPFHVKNNISGYVMVQWCSLAKTDEINEEQCLKWLSWARDLIEVQLSQQPKK